MKDTERAGLMASGASLVLPPLTKALDAGFLGSKDR